MGRPTYPSVNDADNQRLPGRRLPERQVAGGSRFDATEAGGSQPSWWTGKQTRSPVLRAGSILDVVACRR